MPLELAAVEKFGMERSAPLEVLRQLRKELLQQRNQVGHWEGELSASSLSTATAVSALSVVLQSGPPTPSSRTAGSGAEPAGVQASDDQNAGNASATGGTITSEQVQLWVERGVRWLLRHANDDGGFGDTDRSYSNIATSMLVHSAMLLARDVVDDGLARSMDEATERVAEYCDRQGGLEALRRRYGKDKTFVVPILTNCALAGLVDWSAVQPLPFELAAVPQRFYRWMQMPVVSYAIPALVAIGQARFMHRPPRNPVTLMVRRAAIKRTLHVLTNMQPDSGGYLEATPLTSFVLMSLASSGRAEHAVSQRAIQFLGDSIREDGSWPIDTNLATWVTSLSMQALRKADGLLYDSAVPEHLEWQSSGLIEWMLQCQHSTRHPFTGADPGGWGWTDLSGAVPDCDDTPGAVIALTSWVSRSDPSKSSDRELEERTESAISQGVDWILGLQNRDGGWPTFCRGWGKLPFDRSSTDLTAHAIRALHAARRAGLAGTHEHQRSRCNRAVERGWEFLLQHQRGDGAMLPLWFGNQDMREDENPTYGTAKFLAASAVLAEALANSGPGDPPPSQVIADQACGWKITPQKWSALRRAEQFLIASQQSDGGWGGGVSRTVWELRGKLLTHALESDRERAKIEPRSSIEESALALEGLSVWYRAALKLSEGGGSTTGTVISGELAENFRNWQVTGERGCRAAIIRGLNFVCEAVRKSKHHEPWPIGFYFAKLWYHEKLYPPVFLITGIASALEALAAAPDRDL